MIVPSCRCRTTPRRRLRAAALVITCVTGGCARVPPTTENPAWDTRATACIEQFERSDAAIFAAGVVDGEAHRVTGFPFLRINRFLASFVDGDVPAAQREPWLAHAARLDRSGRAVELANAGLDTAPFPSSRLDACRAQLASVIATNAERWRALRLQARHVPDDYASWKRYLGIYPITSRFVLAGIERLHRQASPVALTSLPAVRSAEWVWYGDAPTTTSAAGDKHDVTRDALGVPRLEPLQAQRLLAAHAPAFAVATRDDNDRIGAVRYVGGRVVIDTAQPRVYAYIAHTRFGTTTLVQLVYSVWFPARPLTGPLDLLGGELDAVTWRVTLDTDGAPLIYDAMHACGCYHMFFPTSRLARRPGADAHEEPLWVPFVIPDGWSPAPVVHLASGSHYLTGLSQRLPGVSMRELPVADYDALRTLDDGAGAYRSLFDEHGIVTGSRRAERWVLWPMGIRSPGAMRQRGRHATAFVGRRHFDEAGLIERYFTRTRPR